MKKMQSHSEKSHRVNGPYTEEYFKDAIDSIVCGFTKNCTQNAECTFPLCYKTTFTRIFFFFWRWNCNFRQAHTYRRIKYTRKETHIYVNSKWTEIGGKSKQESLSVLQYEPTESNKGKQLQLSYLVQDTLCLQQCKEK